MNSTREPGGTVTAAGFVPLDVSVIVVLGVGVPPGSLGPLGDDPQFTANVSNAAAARSRPRVSHVGNVCSISMLDRLPPVNPGAFRLRKSLRNK